MVLFWVAAALFLADSPFFLSIVGLAFARFRYIFTVSMVGSVVVVSDHCPLGFSLADSLFPSLHLEPKGNFPAAHLRAGPPLAYPLAYSCTAVVRGLTRPSNIFIIRAELGPRTVLPAGPAALAPAALAPALGTPLPTALPALRRGDSAAAAALFLTDSLFSGSERLGRLAIIISLTIGASYSAALSVLFAYSAALFPLYCSRSTFTSSAADILNLAFWVPI